MATPLAPVTIPVPDDDLERGWRYVRRVLPDGEEVLETVALTEADILNPQEEDVMPQRPVHERVTRDVINMLEMYYRRHPLYTVFHDLIMDWGMAGLENPSPDIAVVPGVRHPEAIGGRFDVQQEGTRPVLVIEVVSPHYVDADTNPQKKVRIYETAGVQEYVILDPGGYTPTPVVGYRLGRGKRYRRIPLNAQGRVECRSLRLFLGLDGEQVVVTTTAGEPLLTHFAQADRADEAEQRALDATTRAQEAETRAQAEAQARAQAEAELARLRAELASRYGEQR